jgi:hypothetical protein
LPQAISEFFRERGRKRWAGKSKAEKKAAASGAARAYWASMSREERTKEMRQRATVRKRNRQQGFPSTNPA